MNKKILIISIVTLLALAVGVFWFAQNDGDNVETTQNIQTKEKNITIETTKTQNDIQPPTITPTNPTSTPQKEEIAQNTKKETTKQFAQNEETEIDTSDWKEYCNQEYGFCLKYPEGWDTVWSNDNLNTNLDEGSSLQLSGKTCKNNKCNALSIIIAPRAFFVDNYQDLKGHQQQVDSSIIHEFKFNGMRSAILSADWNKYQSMFINQDGNICNNNGGQVLKFAILDTPKKWNKNMDNIFIDCRESYQAVLINKILQTLKLF